MTRPDETLDRGRLLAAIGATFAPLPWALACWEGGSAAFGRADELSDLDVELIVEDGRVADAFATMDAALAALSPIELRWDVPQPTWHGAAQVFYRLRDAGEFLLVDFAVWARAQPHPLAERERHGERRVLFDKAGVAAQGTLDRTALAQRVADRLANLRVAFPMFQSLVKKELARGRAIDAHAFYVTHTLNPLITLLRIRHCPERFDFGARYLGHDLPRALADEVRALWYVGSEAELEAKRARAEALFAATLAEIDARGSVPA